ncbi:MAG TPA: helix-turn-helix domain-containing protein, partial [Burkholderiales bacterium]|nr:helix-turn-helix domain-containing protein [Burkholderiales bacterium]
MTGAAQHSSVFERVSRAIGILNTLRLPAIRFGRLSLRYLHWGVTPPAYWTSRRHANPCEIHKHSYYEICHALTGKGTFTALNPVLELPVAEGDTFFARPGLVHQYGSALESPLGICFWSVSIEGRRSGSGRNSQEGTALLDAVNSGPLVIRQNARASAVLSLIFDEALGLTSSDRLQPLLQYLALSLRCQDQPLQPARAADPGDASPGVNLWRICQFVQDNCHRKLRIGDLRDKSGYSTRHLTRLFKTQLGESFSDYLARVRIQTASHLLLDDS